MPHYHHRTTSSGSSLDLIPPSTPPPTTISELESRTFATLKRRNVIPSVDSSIRLIQCASCKDTSRSNNGKRNGGSTSSSVQTTINMGLVKCLIAQPRFLSVTLTDSEPASILLEKRLQQMFDPADVLLGSKDDILIPITLDLQELPLESTGIVCGVAGRLLGGTSGGIGPAVEMSYLSTARAGTVMVAEDELDRALATLKSMENGVH